jgi:hypothetical protein
MRVRTLSSLALGRVPSAQWNALDEHVQQCLFPTELRRAVGRFQRVVLTRRSERRAAFARVLAFQEAMSRRVRLKSFDVRTKEKHCVPAIGNGDHVVVVVRGLATRHGIALRSDSDVINVVHVDTRTLRVVDLDTFLGSPSCEPTVFGVARYEPEPDSQEESPYAHEAFYVFGAFLHWMQRRDRAIELALAMTKMHPDDLREYDVIRQDPQCFAWACWMGRLNGVDARSMVQCALDVSLLATSNILPTPQEGGTGSS